MAFGVAGKAIRRSLETAAASKGASGQGQTQQGPLNASIFMPVGMADEGEQTTLSLCGLRHSTGLSDGSGRRDCSNFWAIQCGGGAQDALEAAPGLLRRIWGVLLLWWVDHVQDEGRGNQAHQPWHQSCTQSQPSVRRLPQLVVQHQPAETPPPTSSDCAFAKATESLKPGGSPGLRLPACKSLVMN